MRLRCIVRTRASEMPWSVLHEPGRALVYHALQRSDPELGTQLHDHGWGPFGMVPFGYHPPIWPHARRQRGSYAAGGTGVVEFGSPLARVLWALAEGLAGQEVWDWGGVALQVQQISPVPTPTFQSGEARFRTLTPVILRSAARDENGTLVTKRNWLLPGAPEWGAYCEQNLRRKAETIGVDPDVVLDEVLWVGAQRSHTVGGGKKVCAPVEVTLRGAPETLQALWSWGLGLQTSCGFGWVRA